MQLSAIASRETGLTYDEIQSAVLQSLDERILRHVLIIPPDFTRLYSNAGLITNMYYHTLIKRGCIVDIMPALGTHVPVTPEEAAKMFGDIPFDRFIEHNWREDTITLGKVPGELAAQWTDGLWTQPINAEINRIVMDERYDLIISVGQVVPHEVIGMANHAKNLLVGVGGSDMINKSHMMGAVYGMERMMGRDHTPVRQMFDYCMEQYLYKRPILFALTVCTAPQGEICTHGLFIGQGRRPLDEAIPLAQEKNIDFVPQGIKKCVVYLEPGEFRTTWLGNKAIYRTRTAMADGGELIVLAPGIERFGEDKQVDALIRKYGYRGRINTLKAFENPNNTDLRENMGAAAHLIHGSSDGRFDITYAVKNITQKEIKAASYTAIDYDEVVEKYNPNTLQYGYNDIESESVFYIPNPALGLWIDRSRFNNLG